MDESKDTPDGADLEVLKALEADISELKRLEALLDRYNVFEAVSFDKGEAITPTSSPCSSIVRREHCHIDVLLTNLTLLRLRAL